MAIRPGVLQFPTASMSELVVPNKSRKKCPNRVDSLELLINFRESEGKLLGGIGGLTYLPLVPLVLVVVVELVPLLPTRFVSDW